MRRPDFIPKYQHRYTQACVNGEWYPISHFAKIGTHWKVWLCNTGKFTDISEVSSWEYCNF